MTIAAATVNLSTDYTLHFRCYSIWSCAYFLIFCFWLQILFSEARVMGLGPRFMSIYIQKLAVSSFLLYGF